MSCVAELKASSHRQASEYCQKLLVGRVSATPARPAPMSNCMAMIHRRLVLRMSTRGLQNGLMTQGRYSQLV